MTLLRNLMDLHELAGRYANERRVPMATILKEILHYEILYALTESDAARYLVFQGGTALRLCYQGTRYSEDLDFTCGTSFDPRSMKPFADILQREIASAYGLEVEVKEPAEETPSHHEGVPVARWSAKIRIPNADPRVKQSQVIHIEVAGVPAHDPELVSITANYPHLPEPLRQMIIAAESQNEILADKLVALGARPFLKARDLWDIKFLTDANVAPDYALVRQKIFAYGWTADDFRIQLKAKLQQLDAAETADHFRKEMSRFVDTRVARMLDNAVLCGKYLTKAKKLGQELILTLENERHRPR
ncbi:MAG: nucleotidyl transferase AbiEii/AbiGii toxin family protein [Paludibacterium sp.]|uniref:nucleotidyl transferase AbiEii/AbiGii toxin family protein n=1 Tax=Paludibacterium sp. TaxID=1917523 RepID=UPI0025CD1CD6|nr:nucleotidyl transferase AbiEii/AbiGii toxin family protein [Paludibacterium sp.]MBV8047134.1 nucleotidyl transferase AbiEii/AbiGii toxin family protein [Paludibacterium sp.]MBV8648735.1 nucleotidyl transferase AbiEii/AbiGii toxin family protein [Paludibacterium sp.]